MKTDKQSGYKVPGLALRNRTNDANSMRQKVAYTVEQWIAPTFTMYQIFIHIRQVVIQW